MAHVGHKMTIPYIPHLLLFMSVAEGGGENRNEW
jgi:hypothetical protein